MFAVYTDPPASTHTAELSSLEDIFDRSDRDPRAGRSPAWIPAVFVAVVAVGLGGWWFAGHNSTPVGAGVSAPTPDRSLRGAEPDASADAPDPGGSGDGEGLGIDGDEGLGDPVIDLTELAVISAAATSADGADAGGAPVSYDVSRLTDGSTTTTWRMDGDGTGSSITFTFAQPVTINAFALTNGYTKLDPLNGADRYAEERRITQVTVTLGDDTRFTQSLTDGVRELQQVPLTPTYTSSLTLTIDATTFPGDPDRDYTAISEIQIQGTSPDS